MTAHGKAVIHRWFYNAKAERLPSDVNWAFGPSNSGALRQLLRCRVPCIATACNSFAEFNLGRPTVDTLTASSFPNMKEIRFNCDGVWRFAFAFDQTRSAIVLCGGDKEDVEQKKFYKSLIKQADARFSAHIGKTKEKKA
jgi:hypothetical protein